MKKNIRKVLIAIVIILTVGLTSCSPAAKDILNKYETCSELQPDTDEPIIDFNTDEHLLVIKYSYPLLSSNEKYVRILANRWFVADAENPSVKLPIDNGIATVNLAENANTDSIIYEHHIAIGNIRERFLLIGFEGIDPSEAEVVNIPPLFFLVENNRKKVELLTDKPRIANDLFAANYEKTWFAEYSKLTVKEINLNLSTNNFTISMKSLVLTDEKEVEVIVTDFDEWFKNVKFKNEFLINGGMEMSSGSTGQLQVIMADNAKLQIDFEIDEKMYVLSLSKGAELFTEKTATGKYILLPEETNQLSLEPIIKEK